MATTKKYNKLCSNFKNTLQRHGIQLEDDIFELAPTDKHEYFENI